MTPEEQIAALTAQVDLLTTERDNAVANALTAADVASATIRTLQQTIGGEPARTAAAVQVATVTLAATIDQRAAYASGLESQLTATQAERDAALKGLGAATQERDAALTELAALKPPAGSVITVTEFKKRLAPAYLVLASKPAELQGKWDRIMTGLLGAFTAVTLTDALTVAMVGTAVADGVLTEDQAKAVLATG